MQKLMSALAAAFLLLGPFSSATLAQSFAPKKSAETRKLLAALNDVRINDDKLSALFRVGDERVTDLIRLLDNADPEISLRAQVVVRYLGNEAGMRALRVWYSKQRDGYTVAGPVPQPLDEWDYRNIRLNLLGNSPHTWGTQGVKYIHALALNDSAKAKSLLAELISTADGLTETNFIGNAIRRVQTLEASDKLVGRKDIAKQVLRHAFFISPEDRKYATARLLALSGAKDKALVEVHINRGILAEEWYHVVLRRCAQGWEFFSITPVAVS